MYCHDCESSHCTCKKSLAIPEQPPAWLIHSCVTPGCGVTIRVPINEQYSHGPCKWCRGQSAYNTRDPSATHASTGPCLSREEFGFDLCAAIEAQAGAVQAMKRSAVYTAKGRTRPAEEAETDGRACQRTLDVIFQRNTIGVDDVRRILAMS